MQIKHLNSVLFLKIIFVFSVKVLFGQNATVYFKTNDYSLDKKSIQVIDSLIKIKDIEKIILKGHCDNLGNHTLNDELSINRVNTVKAQFILGGINNELIETKALGKRIPLNKNINENERALNRCVEIEFTFKTKVNDKETVLKKLQTTNELEIIISGIILNENNKPIIAEITLNDKNGNEIKSIKSNKDGKYNFKTNLKQNEDYALTYYNDSSFISSKIINISNPRLPYKNLKTILLKLKEGNKYILENLNFEGDTSQLVSVSISPLNDLYKLMNKNKSLIIKIEGHVNYPNSWPNPKFEKRVSDKYVPAGMNSYEFNQWLSDERAKMVYNFLVEKGINANRMTTVGYGAKKMLYPDAITEYEMAKNRRVEINIISYKRKNY
jgi:outer membrane protein OmpA-like peptidoglycan-associated protein